MPQPKKKKKVGTVQGPSLGGGVVAAKPGNTGLGSGAPVYTGAPLPLNPYTATAPPIDPNYDAYRVSSGRNLALANADATYAGAQIENQYGLGSDTSNPYSRAKLLEETYKRSQRGTLNNYAAQGQLYSGAYGRMQGENKRNYSMGYDELARSYQDAKRTNTRNQLGAYADYGVGVDDAQFNSLLRALG